jgi:phosphoribosylglycinamide formyltransferase 2
VESVDAARAAAAQLGFPCVFKSMMSSSGHGMTAVRTEQEIPAAFADAVSGGRVESGRVMIEEFIPFDQEITMLTLRHYEPSGSVTTSFCSPVAHYRPGTLYHESWQPAELPASVVRSLERTARAVTNRLGGFGMFGVECFLREEEVLFSEVSPRPHDTGLVTLGSQWNSEFALHARAILGLPYVGPEAALPAAAHVILSSVTGWAPSFGGLTQALAEPAVRLFLFGKPEAYPDRRLGVAVARGTNVVEARARAESAAHAVEASIRVQARDSSDDGAVRASGSARGERLEPRGRPPQEETRHGDRSGEPEQPGRTPQRTQRRGRQAERNR